jgi:IclR family transcriptional regulator, acetate operon repressor
VHAATSTADGSFPARATGPAASTRAVDRALALLAEVCTHDSPTLADCARRTSLPPSTALRLLRTLESKGFVERDRSGTFAAGPRLLQLGAMAYGRQSLVAEAEPAMRRIVDERGESTYLAVPGPSGTALYVGMVEGTYSVRHASWVGRTVTLDGTAVGAAMLGWTGPDGFVALRSAVEIDVAAVAAPLRRAGAPTASSPAGPVVGALTVVGPSYRLDDHRLHEVGRIVSREARALSQRFGVLPEDRMTSA